MGKYAAILDEAIYKSGMTLTELSQRCEEKGVKVTVSYLSKLRNGKMLPPSFKITLLLAEILDVDPKHLLSAGRNDRIEEEQKELAEALGFIYPNNEEEKANEIHELLADYYDVTDEEIEEMQEQAIDLKKLLSHYEIVWDDRELSDEEKERLSEIIKLLLSLDNNDRKRAFDLIKVFSNNEKDTN